MAGNGRHVIARWSSTRIGRSLKERTAPVKTLMSRNGRRNVVDSVASHWRPAFRRLAALVAIIVSFAAFAPTTYASGPGSAPNGQPHPSTTTQDPQWMKAKLELRVSSGIVPGQGKGARTHPSILPTPPFNPSVKGASLAPNSGTPSAYTLSYAGTGVQWAAEPGDGKHYNFPESNWEFTYDDAYHHYADGYMDTLCGPGAA